MDLNTISESITTAVTDAGPLLAAASMLADHAEETGTLMGDRLATESEGNVIMTAQSATTETFNAEIDLNPSDAAGTGDLSGTQSVILEKFYHLTDITWNHSNPQWHESKVFDFPHGLFPRDLDTIYVLAQFFQFFCFYRFGAVIKITCNFSPGCSGILIVFYEPKTTATGVVERRNPTSVRCLPHCTINAKSASEGQFTIPFNFEQRMYSDTMREVGEVRKIDWAPLANVAGTQSDTTLSVWFRLIDVKVASLSVSRQPFTTAQYADTKRSFQRALNVSMEKHGHGLAFLQDFLEQVVVTGVERECLSGLKDEMLRSVRNLQQTLEETELDSEVGDEVKNFAMTTANTVNNQSRNVPIHDLSFDGDNPPSTNSFASHEPFKLSDYMTIPTAIKDVLVETSQGAGHLLYSFPVTPDFCYSEDTDTVLAMWDTPASAMAKHFGYWRGTMKILVEDAASRLHSFRYKAIYVPNVTSIKSSDKDYASCQTVTCDIGLQETVSMAIAFQAPTDWKRTISFHESVADFKAKCSELKHSTGQIGIYVMNPLNSTSASSASIKLIVQIAWAIEFAYPIFQPDHVKMVHPSLEYDSEVNEAQGSMVASSSDEGSGGVEFETSQPLPETYMGNHMDLNKLMTRPIHLTSFTFSGSSVEQTVIINMAGHQAHLNSFAAYWRGRPVLTLYARHSGDSIKGGLAIGFVPLGFYPFGDAGNTYLESARLLLTNGAYYMNLEQEKTCVLCLPYYQRYNFLTTGLPFGEVKIFPLNANGVVDVYLSWSADYKQYFPLRTPTTYSKQVSGEKKTVKPKPFKLHTELEGMPEPGSPLDKYIKQINAEKEEWKMRYYKAEDTSSDEGTEDEPEEDLTGDGGVERNPGPKSWISLLTQYISLSQVSDFMDEDQLGDTNHDVVYTVLSYATVNELEFIKGCYVHERCEQHDYAPPEESYAVQMCMLALIEVRAGREDWDPETEEEKFQHWLLSFNPKERTVTIPYRYFIELADGDREPVYAPRHYERDSFWESLEDNSLDSLGTEELVVDDYEKEYNETRVTFAKLMSQCRPWDPRVALAGPRGIWEEDRQQTAVHDKYGQYIERADPHRTAWDIANENMYVGKVQIYKDEAAPFSFLQHNVTLDLAGFPGAIVLGFDTTSSAQEYVYIVTMDSNLVTPDQDIIVWMKHGPTVCRFEFQLKQLTPVFLGFGPLTRCVYTGIQDLRFLLILAGDVETNPGPDWEMEEIQSFQASIKEKFDKYSHKKLRLAECPLQFMNMMKQNVAFHIMRFTEKPVSQTKQWCGLKIKVDLREQADFEVDEIYEKEFSFVGPNKRVAKNECAIQFIYSFKCFLQEMEINGLAERIAAEDLDSEGLFDGIMNGITSGMAKTPPALKMLEAVESITTLIGKVDKFVTEGVNQVVAVLAIIVKIILGVINIHTNPSVCNVGYVVANFLLDIVSNSYLSKLTMSLMTKLKESAIYLFEKIRGLWATDPMPAVHHDGTNGDGAPPGGWSAWNRSECSSQADEDEDDEAAKERLESVIEGNEMRTEGAPEVLSGLVSVLLIVVTGIVGGSDTLAKCKFGKVVNTIVRSMKGISSLGNGLRGMSNITEYIGKAIHGVVQYVKGGVSEDERANVYFNENKVEIADWSVRVDTFKGTFNENEARIQPDMRSVIDDLYNRGCAIHAGCLFAKDAGAVFTKLTINFKDVSEWQDIANKGKRGVEGRPEPTVILLRGDPGQGKSLLTTRLSAHFAQFFGRTRSNGVHACNPYSEHMDNYAQQPVVVFDDLGQSAEGTDFESFCQLVSTVPFYPKMADLKQKGDQFISPLIIGTTNTKQPRPKTINTVDAVWRRFAFIVDVEATTRNARGELDIQKAQDENKWDDMSCLKLTRFAKIDSEAGTQLTLNVLIERVEDEIVRRQKTYDKIVDNIPPPTRLFRGMMDSECKDCEGIHDISCVCEDCEGVTCRILTMEDFEGRNNKCTGKMIRPVQTGYEGASDQILQEALETVPMWIMEEYGRYGATEDLLEKVKTKEKEKEYFNFRRMIDEKNIRAKKSKLLALWEKHVPKVKEYLVTAAKMCAGLLAIIAAISVFKFISYVRMSKRDQKITTNRMLDCRKVHAVAEWMANKGLECLRPKHKMASERDFIPKYIETDQLVFDDGEVITYHDACVLVPGHICHKVMTHHEETEEEVETYGSSFNFRDDSEGAYNGHKGRRAPGKSKFMRATARPYQSQVGEDNGDARDQVARAVARNVVSVHVEHEDPMNNGHGIATFLSSEVVMMPHHLLSKRGSDDIVTLRFDIGTSGSKDIAFNSARVLSFGEGENIEDFIIYVLESPIQGVRKLATNLFPPEDDFASVVLGGVTMISKRGHLPWTVSADTAVLVAEKEYQGGDFKVTKGIGYALSSDQRGSGDSGALILSRHGVVKDKVCGMHVAGHGAAGVAIPLTYEFIHSVRHLVADKFKIKPIQAPIELDQVMDSDLSKLEVQGVNSYLGKVGKYPVSIMRRSQIKPSMVQGCVEVLREPAPLSARDPRVDEEFKTDPVNNAPRKFANGSGHANRTHLKEVVSHTATVVKSLINPSDPPRVLTDFEMVNGLPLGEGFQQVEMKSSPGWPYAQMRQGGKKAWFKFEGNDGKGNTYTMGESIRERVEEREHLAKHRTRIKESYFTTFLKDELRPIYKVKQNSARTVECGPLDHLLLSRKYFGHFLNVVTKNPVTAFGCCVGINPEVDLSMIENRMREFSDTGMAEDYTRWDGTIKPELIFAAGEVIKDFTGPASRPK